MPQLARRVQKYATTIFTEINQLAAKHNALNLGQGKPDFDTPSDIVAAAVQALNSGRYSQYAPGNGAPALREAIAAHARDWYNLHVDTNTGVIVTCGAEEALFSSILGSIDPGDEVIVIEPFFDTYVPSIEMAGGIPVYVPLLPPTWELDRDALRAAFNERTRAIIINSPNNPTGRVFNATELELIAELCVQYDALCITDEVYEHIVYAPHQHTPIATLPGMWERTLSISSVAKTYSATGWKIGWVYGTPELMEGVSRAHQLATFAVFHAGQIGTAYALSVGRDYYAELTALYTRKRDLLMQGLTAAGLRPFEPQGAFYIMADFSAVFDGDDVAFVRHMIEQVGVAAIPPSSFYSEPHKTLGAKYARFAFCKSDEMLEQAGEKLQLLHQIKSKANVVKD